MDETEMIFPLGKTVENYGAEIAEISCPLLV